MGDEISRGKVVSFLQSVPSGVTIKIIKSL